jgi:hypothetical protein
LPLCDCVVWGACGFPFSAFSIISNFELILKILCFIAYFWILEAFLMMFNGHIKAPRKLPGFPQWSFSQNIPSISSKKFFKDEYQKFTEKGEIKSKKKKEGKEK